MKHGLPAQHQRSKPWDGLTVLAQAETEAICKISLSVIDYENRNIRTEISLQCQYIPLTHI